MLDVIVVGAGIIGASVAYRLSQLQLNVMVLEKENDVAMGTTRANSAIVHAGYDPEPGTQMAKLNVQGNAIIQKQCADLQVLCHNIGSLVLAFTEEEMQTIKKLYYNGVANAVPQVQILNKEQVLAKEPNLSSDVKGALFAPSACVIDPWDYCLALCEVAAQNGVAFSFNNRVLRTVRKNDVWQVETTKDTYEAKFVVNAAGVQADLVASMTGKETFHTIPSKGEYYLLDKSQGKLVNHVIFQCPNPDGKGVLVSPTVHGNLIVGPNAHTGERASMATTAQGLSFVQQKAVKSVPCINFRENVRNFAGVRANTNHSDFVLEVTEPCFVTLGGIKSPGLSSAPAIAEKALAFLVEQGLQVAENTKAITKRERKVFHLMDMAQKQQAIAENPLYGRVICRCETITEGEIVDALHTALPAHTLDGVKRRCGAGMGRCQGGFCGPRVHEIIARELGVDQKDVLKDKKGSYIIVSQTKGGK